MMKKSTLYLARHKTRISFSVFPHLYLINLQMRVQANLPFCSSYTERENAEAHITSYS